MQINDKPFSVYDFLGYLIPGIFGIYSFVFLYNYTKYGSFTIKLFQTSKIDEEKIISIIIFYIVGHLLSFFSSMSVEKYSVWTLGYPSSYLFNKAGKRGYFDGCWQNDINHKLGSRARAIGRFLIRFIVLIILLPVFLGDLIVRKIFRLHDMYARPFEEKLLKIVEQNERIIVDTFSEESSEDTSGDIFRLIYHYALEYSSNHINKMQNYVALYGFTRTLTFIGCILFWEWIILNYHSFVLFQQAEQYKVFIGFDLKNFAILFSIFFITFFLYWDFNKFYRKFSIEAYLGAIVVKQKNK